MSDLAFPFPNSPQNDDDFDADPVRENLEYILQILEAFPGDNITAASILEAALADSINPRLRYLEGFVNYVYSGGFPGGFSTLTLTVPSGIAYTSGYRHLIGSNSFTVAVSKDTYFSVNKNGAVDTPQPVANGATVPTLPTDSQWLFKAISNGSTITSLVDLRNRSSTGKGELAYAQVTAPITTTSTSVVAAAGLSVLANIPNKAKITVNAREFWDNTANASIIASLWDGPVGTGTQIGAWLGHQNLGNGSGGLNMMGRIATPGIHSLNVGLVVSAGTGTLGADATFPGFIMVEGI